VTNASMRMSPRPDFTAFGLIISTRRCIPYARSKRRTTSIRADVHYATDVPASKLLADTIHAIMEVNPEYQKYLAAAKAEPRQALELDAQAAK
jgi:DNA-directed RNA polymerase specialized sigma24 family protein